MNVLARLKMRKERQAAVTFASGARGRLRMLAYRAGLALGRSGVRAEGGRVVGFWPEMAPLNLAERDEVRVAVAHALVEEQAANKAAAAEWGDAP